MTLSPKAKIHEGQELARELKKRVSGEVRFDPYSRALYSTDASIFEMEPVGVVIPRSVEDVLAVIDVAAKNRVPVLPRGAGTSLAGQTVNHAIVIDFSKYMGRVLETNPEEGWARVEPGVVLDRLNAHLAPVGLQYAPDPTTSNRACVGGGIGNNTCGSHSVVYGKTLDHVLETSVVLSDGSRAHFRSLEDGELAAKLSGDALEAHAYRELTRIAERDREDILSRYPKIMRRVSGYNLDEFLDTSVTTGKPFNMARMVVGSEGTLCVVTEAKVKLVPVPASKGLAVVHFQDLVQACEATWDILKHGPTAIELIGRMIMDRCRGSVGFSRLMDFVEGDPDALLVVEFAGDSDEEVSGKLRALKADMEGRGLGYECLTILDPASQAKVWALRSAGLGLLMSTRGDFKPLPYVEDTAVDPQRMGDYVRRFDEIVRSHNTTAGYYGHASVGCLHIRPLVNLKTREGLVKMQAIAEDITDLVLEFGGALSGEHGDGIVRGAWTEKMFGPTLYQSFREIKRAFDPDGIMNPGKIVDCPPMTENLRYKQEQPDAPIETKMDFSADIGYMNAVEMCNGMGACRKAEGTMCPSYMVTREEEHSTRGRANLLRAVLSGAMPGEDLTSRRLHGALDLCLECKACKAECQTGVDMAKLKYEFLDKYHEAHGLPLRARLFANVNALGRLGSRLAPLSNFLSGNPLSRLAFHILLGIHAARRPPKFTRRTFPERYTSKIASGEYKAEGPLGQVVLFNDTFMNYHYPQVGEAAVEILQKAGFGVILANAACCARPMVSKGLLDRAKSHARHNVDLLFPYAEQGVPVIGCEPSCLLTLRDEYPDLLGDDKARAVAANAYLIDEFLVLLQQQGRLDLRFNEVSKKLLFHGHCHQKALVGTAHSMATLGMPKGYTVEQTNAGCCGMAGAFGYEKEHYEISMAIGEERLFPAVRAKGEDWEVAVMGVSCRQQIEQGTNRKARHLVEVLRDALI